MKSKLSNKKQGILAFMAVLMMAVLVSSCGSRPLFENYKEIPHSGWNKDSLVTFNVELADTIDPYDLYLSVRNRGNYSYRNLWLFVSIKAPSGEVLTDTVEYSLADQTGRWLGKGIGDLFDSRFLYKGNVRFPNSGEYQFTIRQGMRKQTLKGINDIGLCVKARK